MIASAAHCVFCDHPAGLHRVVGGADTCVAPAWGGGQCGCVCYVDVVVCDDCGHPQDRHGPSGWGRCDLPDCGCDGFD